MKYILVPCDGSESALRAARHAAALASLAGPSVEIHLLHVVEPMTPVTLFDSFASARLDERFPPQAAAALEPAIEVLVQSGVKYSLHCRFGHPAAEIAAHAVAADCDQIVMGTRGAGALVGLVIGSVATRVVHMADIPVTLVK